jgi:hypothetical protein
MRRLLTIVFAVSCSAPAFAQTPPTIPFDAATDPDETQPWTICISNGPTQYLFTNDQEPTRTTGACRR